MDYKEPSAVQQAARVLSRKDADYESLEGIAMILAFAIADQTKLIYEKRKQMLWPKDMEKGLTELDRTTRLNGDLAFIERDLILLNKLEALVIMRLELLKNP